MEELNQDTGQPPPPEEGIAPVLDPPPQEEDIGPSQVTSLAEELKIEKNVSEIVNLHSWKKQKNLNNKATLISSQKTTLVLWQVSLKQSLIVQLNRLKI